MGDAKFGDIQDGWFTERCVLWPGQAMKLQVSRVVHREQSDLQDILIFDSTDYGRVLVLDGVIQVTERDEFAYQEMLTHLALCSHDGKGGKSVCVVGGGDGGIVREVLRHESVTSVTLCEIDRRVVELCREHLPSLSRSLSDPRVEVVFADGAAYLSSSERRGTFDVIITDSSDPVGPAETLFEDSYTGAVHSALKENGIMAAQGECMWLHLELIRSYLGRVRRMFARASYAYTCIPTYPSGQIGIVIAGKGDGAGTALSEPRFELPDQAQKQLRYYSASIHRASFVLPEFARRALEASEDSTKHNA